MERTFGRTTWIDLIKPDEKTLEDVQIKFKLHKAIIEELRVSSARSKVQAYGGYIYLIYYFPVYDPAEQTSRRCEIDFVITDDTVITVHYEEIEPIKEIKELKQEFKDSFELTYKIISSLLNYQERQLHHIREKVESVGSMLFLNKERDVLRTVSRLKRDISEYRIISRQQTPLLESLLGSGLKFFGNEEANKPYVDALVGGHIKILNFIEDYREAVLDYEHTNDQLMNLKINEALKTFTILSFLTFPFVLFVAIADADLMDNPFRDIPGGFYIVIALVAAGMLALYNYFKNKRFL